MSCVKNQNLGFTPCTASYMASNLHASPTGSSDTNPFSQLGNLGGLQSSNLSDQLQGPMKQAMQQLMAALNHLSSIVQQSALQNSNSNGFGGYGSGDGGRLGRPHFGRGGQNVGRCCPSNQSPWTVTNTGNGQAHIDLGNYTLDLNKANSGWTLTNKQTGATTQVSGDPHVSESGNNWTFKNNDTFQLNDGTRITVKTIPAGNGATVTSGLNITSPSGRDMSVTGLGGSRDGQLQVTQGLNPRAVASNSGGNVLYENGNNWTLNGHVVNADLANQMKL